MNIDPLIAQATAQSSEVQLNVTNAANGDSVTPLDPISHERWTKLPKARGRQPKDPHAQSIRFACRDTDDLERQLREYLQQPTAPAQHVTLEFAYPVSSAFSVYTADIRNKRNTQQDEKVQHLYGKLDKSAISVIDALAQTIDPKDQMRRQKAIAKVCVEACERADGYRYSFHNNWLSREDKACRFSYFCNDSTLNKGRAANEGANTSGKKMRKAVYDCQGLIAVKFSLTNESLEVHYRHIPLHKTYVERAPLPRKDSKRYKLMEIFEPEKLPLEQPKHVRSHPPSELASNKRPRKRRATEPPPDQGLSNSGSRLQGDEVMATLPDSTPMSGQIGSSHYGRVQAVEQVGSVHAESSESTSAPGRPRIQGYRPPPNIHKVVNARNHLSKPKIAGSTRSNASRSTAITEVQRGASDDDVRHDAIEAPVNPQERSSANAISMSDFEALKAKLEAAEQRIKNLEAEKQNIPAQGQPSTWGQFPPSQYPYPYPPPAFPYPPPALLHSGYQAATASAAPGRFSGPPSADSPNNHAVNLQPASQEPSSDGSARKEHARPGEAKKVRGFVEYTPKPQRPVLEAQRQDAARLSNLASRRQPP